MNTMLCPLALLLSIAFLGSTVVNGVSVCDEVDVVFLLDTASILQNEAKIIRFIDSIILNGSSEFTGFSAVSYGHHLPITADPVLFHLDDTKHIVHRRETQRVVHEALTESFAKIKTTALTKAGLKGFCLFTVCKYDHTLYHLHRCTVLIFV